VTIGGLYAKWMRQQITAIFLLPATFDDHEGVTIHEHELMNMVSPS
jgi:hypothetical protein